MPSTPRKVVVDSGPLIALFDVNDPFHEESIEFIRSTSARLVSNVVCLAEAMFLLDFSIRAQTNLLAFVDEGGIQLEEISKSDLLRVSQLLPKYADQPMDFADALLVVLCERLNISEIATFDTHFRIYRMHGRRPFVNVMTWEPPGRS